MNDFALPPWFANLLILVGIGAAIFERWRSARLSVMVAKTAERAATVAAALAAAEAHKELTDLITASRDEWKARYDTEHSEYIVRRQQYHDEAQKVTARLLMLSEENANYKLKTDVSPILAELRAQAEINKVVLKGLETITLWCSKHENGDNDLPK